MPQSGSLRHAMPVTFEIDPERSLSIVTFAGPFTVEEAESALAAFRAQGGQDHPCIFQFDRPVAQFRPENIKRVVSDMSPAGGGRPSAFVGDNDLSYEVCSVIVHYIGRPASVRAFRTREEAEAWLRERSAEKA